MGVCAHEFAGDGFLVALGYERNESEMSIPLTALLPHSDRLLTTVSGAYGGCLQGAMNVPRLRVVCEDSIMHRLLSKLHVFERWPDGVRLVVSQKCSRCEPFSIDMSPVATSSDAKSYRFPYSSAMCDSVLKVLEHGASTRQDNVDWDLVKREMPTAMSSEPVQLSQPINNTGICKSIEPLVNHALDVLTFQPTYHTCTQTGDVLVVIDIADRLINIAITDANADEPSDDALITLSSVA
ncbi:hypothetical protein GNI_013900 [Gregarina niphandrodes]|uniref:Uncharacterized protein n=1 Tax=Gregarina niphandrodes TaxID=110365 RepID=A0A023BCJ4_GRENI|nr:hypothetical protein GNI_013900 [Gregarina niphandrodes]EZG83907.1 hypothetical protein GNI_013900 [Gregarina niphandrodes]|eukprot:XP_011128906.1 hypothetical protein GNI_013900 [Gregarina niphandrodes]